MYTAAVFHPDWSPAMSVSITVSHTAVQVAGRSYKAVPTVATRSVTELSLARSDTSVGPAHM